MIRPLDAFTLAITKLRTRKIRTSVTVAIAGLLFGLVMIVVIVSDGVFTSVEQMTSKSMTGRYIIGGMQPYSDTSNLYADKTLIARAKADYKTLVADKKAEAKRLGIEYDAATEVNPVDTMDGQESLSSSSPITQKLINEEMQKITPRLTIEDFKKIAAPYQPRTFYQVQMLSAKDGSIAEMKKGQEEFTTRDQDGNGMQPDIQEMSRVPKALLMSYLFKDYKWQSGSGHIPVVVSQKRAAQLANLPAPKSDAPAAQRLNYINALRQKANGTTFSACYRNLSSSNQIAEALAAEKEIAEKKNDKTYQKPRYLLGTPDPSSCGAAVVVQDKRTADEKAYFDKQRQFDTKFGIYIEPVQQKIVYEVVGVAPNGWADMDQNAFSTGIGGLVSMMLMTQSFRLAVPEELYATLPNKSSLDAILAPSNQQQQLLGLNGQFYAEFTNAANARDFAKEQSCIYGPSGCEPKTKPFNLQPFGSNSIGLDEAKSVINLVLLWAIGIVGCIAALIASFTIGRTIADGRRETAVFRAIGFKRMDISQVYATYTLLLSLRIVIFALAIGLIAALVINHFFWVDTTSQLRLVLGLYDDDSRFSFVGWSTKLLLAASAVILSGLVGMVLPLLRNVRRNPIADMRDE